MNAERLNELLLNEVQDLYDAEKQLVKTLPRIVKACASPELAEAIESHLEETRTHVERLEKVFQLLDESPKSKPCKGMKGLLEEGAEVIEQHEPGILRDLGIISGAQRVEHYEMSAYGTASAIADAIGHEEVLSLLQETAEEEQAADSKLSDIAQELYAADDDAELETVSSEKKPAAAASGRARRSAATGR